MLYTHTRNNNESWLKINTTGNSIRILDSGPEIVSALRENSKAKKNNETPAHSRRCARFALTLHVLRLIKILHGRHRRGNASDESKQEMDLPPDFAFWTFDKETRFPTQIIFRIIMCAIQNFDIVLPVNSFRGPRAIFLPFSFFL